MVEWSRRTTGAGSVRLLGPRAPVDHRVDRLEVARVRREHDAHLGVVIGQVAALGAEVVLHVVGAALRRGRRLDAGAPRLELGEDRLVADADDVGEHVEPPAVRHADHHLARALVGRVTDDDVEHRHHRVEALDAEPLLAQVGLVQEALEGLDADQPLEQRDAVLGLHRPPVLAGLDHAAQPDALGVRGDVLDLVGDRAGVGLLQVRAAPRPGSRRGRRCAAARPAPAPCSPASGPAARDRGPGRRAARRRADRGARPCGRSGGRPSPAPSRRRRP